MNLPRLPGTEPLPAHHPQNRPEPDVPHQHVGVAPGVPPVQVVARDLRQVPRVQVELVRRGRQPGGLCGPQGRVALAGEVDLGVVPGAEAGIDLALEQLLGGFLQLPSLLFQPLLHQQHSLSRLVLQHRGAGLGNHILYPTHSCLLKGGDSLRRAFKHGLGCILGNIQLGEGDVQDLLLADRCAELLLDLPSCHIPLGQNNALPSSV
mmetsp:Transcript_87659/g.200287  ORF Transcript_87659/g.200287 Transcript_87659/m.200287 type:complete len:207 (-) Transcript_87659:66-686(-)